MATVASSTPALNITYTLNDLRNGGVTSEYYNVGYTTLEYPDGTGTGQITIGVIATGYISSGETIRYDFQKFPKTTWDKQITLDFTSSFDSSSIDNPERGVKGMVVINNWAGSSGGGIEDWFPISGLPRINIHATGDASSISGGFSGLFNDGSGNIAINPQGTWAFTDTIGQTPVFDTVAPRYDHVISLTTENFTNVSGSGGLSSGTSGDAVYYPIWNDVTSGSPWSGNLPRLSYEILVIGVTG
jgi:hypothetical protein